MITGSGHLWGSHCPALWWTVFSHHMLEGREKPVGVHCVCWAPLRSSLWRTSFSKCPYRKKVCGLLKPWSSIMFKMYTTPTGTAVESRTDKNVRVPRWKDAPAELKVTLNYWIKPHIPFPNVKIAQILQFLKIPPEVGFKRKLYPC